MTWFYSQKSGELRKDDELVGTGYSGAGEYKNDPFAQRLHNKGPIPRGTYYIQAPIESVEHGPFTLPLRPDSDNTMFGRGGFLIHGDSITDPGNASEGCIATARANRVRMWNSGDRELVVTE